MALWKNFLEKVLIERILREDHDFKILRRYTQNSGNID